MCDCELKNESADREVVQSALDAAGVTVKAWAARCGFAVTTCYDFLTGRKTMPSFALRQAFELTSDLAILNLISGEIPLTFNIQLFATTGQPRQPVRIPPIGQLMPSACDSVKLVADSLIHLNQIVADGKIDHADAASIRDCIANAAAAQKQLALVTAALQAHAKKEAVQAC